jgi:hypothetical protein
MPELPSFLNRYTRPRREVPPRPGPLDRDVGAAAGPELDVIGADGWLESERGIHVVSVLDWYEYSRGYEWE